MSTWFNLLICNARNSDGNNKKQSENTIFLDPSVTLFISHLPSFAQHPHLVGGTHIIDLSEMNDFKCGHGEVSLEQRAETNRK